jgi:hypothetical protein
MFTTDRWIPFIDALEERLEPEITIRAQLLGHNVTTDLNIFHNDIESLRQQVINRREFILQQVNPLTAPKVIETQPEPYRTLVSAPAAIVLTFSEAIDASTIRPQAFSLVRSGGDDAFGQANDVVITPGTPELTSPTTARIPLDGVTLAYDRYRLTVLGSGYYAIRDTAGVVLDGEQNLTLPSGDGTPGGNFVLEFILSAVPSAVPGPRWELYR